MKPVLIGDWAVIHEGSVWHLVRDIRSGRDAKSERHGRVVTACGYIAPPIKFAHHVEPHLRCPGCRDREGRS